MVGPNRNRLAPPNHRLALRRPSRRQVHPRPHAPDAAYLNCDLPSVERTLDFVIRRDRDRVDLVECKISPDAAEAPAVDAFRKLYPASANYVVSPGAARLYRLRRGGHVLTVCTPAAV